MLVKIAACVVRHFCAKQRRTRHARSSRQCDCMSLHTARTLAESKRMSTLNQLLLHVHATDACLPACPGRRLNPSANYARSTTESFKRALERALKQETASRQHICRAGCANNSTRTTRAALARAQTRDWPALAGTGTFRVPTLFSGLRQIRIPHVEGWGPPDGANTTTGITFIILYYANRQQHSNIQ